MVAGTSSVVFINEIHYDNFGPDEGEAVEIANPNGLDLAGYTVTFYNSSGAAYGAVSLTSTTDPFVIVPFTDIRNIGPAGIALSDASDNLVQFLSYEGTLTATEGPAAGQTSTDIGVEESFDTLPGFSLALSGFGGETAGDFTWQSERPDTFGSFNAGQSFERLGGPMINEIRIFSGDRDEFIDAEFAEIFGPVGFDLTGISLVEVDGSGDDKGRINSVYELGGQIAADSYFMIFNALAQSIYRIGGDGPTTNANFQNDSSTIFLVAGFTGAIGDDVDSNNDGVIDQTLWSVVFDAVALIDDDPDDVAYSDTVIGGDLPFLPAGAFRSPDGGAFAATPLAPETDNDTPDAPNPIVTPTPTPPPAVVINEARVRSEGEPAADDFVELLADPNTLLTGLSLLLIGSENAPGRVETVVPLDNVMTDANGFALIANPGTRAATDPGDKLVDGLDFLTFSYNLVVVSDALVAPGDDLDSDDDGTLDQSPWTSVIDAVSVENNDPAPDRSYFDTVLNFGGATVPSAIQRAPDAGDFVESPEDTFFDTPGFSNGDAPDVKLIPIYDIQGAGHRSPFNDEIVTTQGVVTSISTNGFFIEDPGGDGDDKTSDAIFILNFDNPRIMVGDSVQVTGRVFEDLPGGAGDGILGSSAMSDATIEFVDPLGTVDPLIIGEDRSPPSDAIDSDGFAEFNPEVDSIDFFESLEGMLVTIKDPLVVAGTNSDGAIYVVPNMGLDGPDLSERGTANIDPLGGTLGVIDTGPGADYNPEVIKLLVDPEAFDTATPQVAVGARLQDVTGIITNDSTGYTFSPLSPLDVLEASILAPETTSLNSAEGDLRIASYNLDGRAPTDDPTALESYVSQIIDRLGSPDIVGLQELFDISGPLDDGTTEADPFLQELADSIADAGGPSYSFIDNPFITDNASGDIPGANGRTAFLYNPDVVSLVDGSVKSIGAADQATNADNPFFDAPLPLVATFAFGDDEITIINVDLTDRDGSTSLYGAQQPPTNGGAQERADQAAAIAELVETILDAGEEVAVIGSFNEVESEDPLDPLYDAGLINLTNTLPDDERYNTIVDGNSQSLDHIFVSPGLASGAQFDVVHIAAEFAADEQTSDRDPILASLELLEDGDPPKAMDDEATTRVRTPVTINVLANDQGEGLAVLGANVLDFAGSAVINDDNTITFTPADTHDRTARIVYTVANDDGGIATATVSVDVVSARPEPLANIVRLDDETSLTLDALVIDVLAKVRDRDVEDGLDELEIVSVASSDNATVTITDDGRVLYTPKAGFRGTDEFFFNVLDAYDNRGFGSVTVQVATGVDGGDFGGSEEDDFIAGDVGDDFIDGKSRSDFLAGLSGNDVILGGDGDDFLSGGKGDDLIVGGAGKDTMYGGAGSNIFRFFEGDLAADPGDSDQITSFGVIGDDRLDFSAIDAIEGGENDPFVFIGTDEFTGEAGQLRIVKNGAFTDVLGDTDGDGKADIAVRLYGDIMLDGSMIIG